MKIKNCARFLVVLLLLISGSTPVFAQTPDQCDSVEPVRPGDTVTDAVSDVPAAHVDITEVETSLSGERLTVVFHLRDLPETLKFNRTEFGQGVMEYEWEVAIDVDNDRSTGPGGFDMLLSAYHITDRSRMRNDADVTAPIGEMLEASVWETDPDGSTSAFADADLAVFAEEGTITIAGVIPGITSESRLAFATDDAQFPGVSDQIACHDPYRKFAGPWQCDVSIAVIHPGQTVLDGIEDSTYSHQVSSGEALTLLLAFDGALSAYMDITKINTSLSGERLTVIFHLRDVPETLTFNRTGISENYMEYAWEVAIDVDNDRTTGDGGFDSLLSAYHIVRPAHGGDNTEAPIEEVAKASVWEMRPGRIMSERDASLEVSVEEDTITISGYIPGITAEARLSFKTNEYSGGSDEVGCQKPPGILTYSSLCDILGAVTPGESVIDDVSDTLPAHMDVTEVSTLLSGETLTVVFHLRDVPETLTFDRTGVPENVIEYNWEVSVNVDGDGETGFQGFEYILSSMYVPSHWSSGRNRSVAITTDSVQTNTWHLKSADGAFPYIAFLDWARIKVSAEEDTITLSGEIPGITADSQLAFGVYDYLGGAEDVGCLTPFGLGRPAHSQSSSDGSSATSGQPVSDDVPDELVGHIDIRDVTTALDGETLSVTFELRDIPETLTFARTGVPEDALEYSWEVSIDVDNDPETGSGGFDYMLSAGYFVSRFAHGSNAVAEITQPGFVKARLWALNREGYRVLAEADVEFKVSVDDNTITLSGEIPGITAESRLKFRAYDFFGGSVEISGHAPSTTGQAADSTPESLAPISVPERIVIPPRYAQHLNSLTFLDGVPAILINHQGDPVTALDVDQMKSDRWLQLWATSAMEDDGALDFAHSITKAQNFAMGAHHIAVIYMNAFAAAEQHCAENREELEALIQMYANQASDLPDIQFPYLTVVHELATRLTQMDATQNVGSCTDHLASLPDFPKVRTFCFGGDANEQVMGKKAMAKQLEVQMEKLSDPTALHSLVVSAANLNCWPDTHE